MHGLDSAACLVPAKGRSSSHQLNSRCRRMASINISGGHEVFYSWMPSGENPADDPSRRYDPSSAKSERAELASSEPTVDIAELGCWPSHQLLFIHLCGGPRRSGDLLDAVEMLGHEHGFDIQGLAIDPLGVSHVSKVGEQAKVVNDLLHVQCGCWPLDFIKSKTVVGGFGSPPCSTISAAGHQPLNLPGHKAPRPLRARSNPWIPLDYCSDTEIHAVKQVVHCF